MIKAVARSLRGKLMLIGLVTTLCALAFTAIALVVYEFETYEPDLVADLKTQAEILAKASETALAFDDQNVAAENLAALRLRPSVVAAALYTQSGQLFAAYPEQGAAVPTEPARPGYLVDGGSLRMFHPIVTRDAELGTLYLETRYERTERIVDLIVILAAVMFASFLITLPLSDWLQRVVAQPILDVTGVARQVMETRDFSLRATASTHDETRVLVDAFNDMLGEVGKRTDALEAAYRTVQHEVGERRAADAALRLADRRKDEFLATLAHELRNPLAPLRNALDILGASELPPRRIALVRDLMARQLGLLTRLVDDLLDVSRISTGKLIVRRERSELAPILGNAVDTVRPLIEAKRQQFSVVSPDAPIRLDADPARLSQVIGNLLNNAAKYTPAGGAITLTVEPLTEEVEIAVADTGIGIPPEMIDRVFEMFTQVDTSLDRATAGLGVGLSLARRLTELHGGSIRVKSDGAGRGSVFTIRLPTIDGAEPVAPAPAPTDEVLTTKRRRILLADDNADFATSLAVILRGMGHDVKVTHDGERALSVAREFHPEVAFLDIGLPKLHGYALARALRNEPSARTAMLVAITGWGQERDRRSASEAGFDHHFLKPVSVEQLTAVLAEFDRVH